MKFILGFGLAAAFASIINAAAPEQADLREQAARLFKAGNFKDAFGLYQKLLFDPDDDLRLAGDDLTHGIQCLQRLGRVNEIDAFREKAAEIHKSHWRVLQAVAQTYIYIEHHGCMVAGKFVRGPARGGGEWKNSQERDRVRTLQLMVQALALVEKEENHAEAASFYLAFSSMIMGNRGQNEAWRLQYLTDLTTLPDYDPGWGYHQEGKGAPVGQDGQPVFYSVPKTWDAAESDGQRWRWCLQQAAEMNPQLLNHARIELARFLHGQFGVQTMAHYGWRFGQIETDETKKNENGTYALHTLGENETIARLATGIKRFILPDEFNYIKIFQQIGADSQSSYAMQSLATLASIFENRRQYAKAAQYWQRLLK
jgi:alpha-2-macroglobulin